mgnify:CR=1 FL=1
MTDQMSDVTPVDLPVDLPVVSGGDNKVSAVNFETVTQLRGRVASRLSADGVSFRAAGVGEGNWSGASLS